MPKVSYRITQRCIILSWFFCYRKKAFLENVPIGISRFARFCCTQSWIYEGEKKNPGIHCCVVLHVLRFLAGLISSLHLSCVGFLVVLSGKNREKCVYSILSHNVTVDF